MTLRQVRARWFAFMQNKSGSRFVRRRAADRAPAFRMLEALEPRVLLDATAAADDAHAPLLVTTLHAFAEPRVASGHTQSPGITFDDVTAASNFDSLLTGEYLHASAWGDVNGDGFADLFAPKFNGFGYPDFGPNRLLINNGDGTFSESVQPAINVNTMAVSGAAFADFDNDGDVDLIVGSFNPGGAGPHYSRIYENDGLGNFTDRTDSTNFAKAELANMPTRTPFTFDYDGDGDLDVLLQHDVYNGSVYQSRLMRNEGNFVFTEQTLAAGLPIYVGPGNEGLQGLGGAVADFDGDGDPDFYFPSPLFRAPNYSMPNNHMFLNDGDGTFTEYRYNSVFNNIADWNPTLNDDWYVGAAAGDLNNDGRIDLVLGQHFVSAPSNTYGSQARTASVRVFLNQGNDTEGVPVFLDVTSAAGIEGIHTIQAHVEIQDMDNDGFMDIVTSATLSDANQGGQQRPVIYRNLLGDTGTLGFELNAGMNPATNSGDWLNDLARDPYYYPGAPTVDFDRDGRLDIMGQEAISNFISTTGTRPSPLFRNTSNPANHYLEIMIDASAEQNVNRQGLGSQVFIYEAGHVGDPAFMLGMQEIEVSNGYSSGTEPIAHFGLGENDAVDVRVVLPWNAGTWTQLNVQANQRVTLGTPVAPYEVLSFDAKGRLQFTDADGDTIQMQLKKGQGEVHVPVGGGDPLAIILSSTYSATSLSIKGQTTLGSITADGALKDIKAKDVTITGDITIGGALGKADLGPVVGPATFTLGGTAGDKPMSFKAVSVRDLTLQATSPIKSLATSDWLNTDDAADHITAPAIDKVAIKGDLEADVIASTPADIKKVSVTGWFSGAAIVTAGNLGSVKLGGMRESQILAGFTLPLLDLPTSGAGFLNRTSGLKSLKLSGAVSDAGDSFIDSLVAGWSLGKVSLNEIQPANNGIDFGVVGSSIKGVDYTTSGEKWKSPKDPGVGEIIRDIDFVLRRVDA